MTDSTSAAPPSGQDRPAERYEVTVLPDPNQSAQEHLAQVSAMDLDRLPDRTVTRLLVDAEQLARLRAEGMVVQVQRPVPIQPLDPSLVADDEDVSAWLSERLATSATPTDEER